MPRQIKTILRSDIVILGERIIKHPRFAVLDGYAVVVAPVCLDAKLRFIIPELKYRTVRGLLQVPRKLTASFLHHRLIRLVRRGLSFMLGSQFTYGLVVRRVRLNRRAIAGRRDGGKLLELALGV